LDSDNHRQKQKATLLGQQAGKELEMKDLIREVVTYLTERKHLIVRTQKISGTFPPIPEGQMQ